jgi:hypothetical protein
MVDFASYLVENGIKILNFLLFDELFTIFALL